MRIFEVVFEVIGWLKIAASPTLVGFILGAIIHANVSGTRGLVLGIAVAVVGIVIGIIWATRVWKKTGTNQFLARTIATPELDNADKKD